VTKQVIDFQKIWPYAPHRPPMIWIDEVVSYGASAGECLVRVRKDAHYMDGLSLRPSSCLEFIAQAYGYMSIAYKIYETQPDAKPLRRAFLASIKDASMSAPDLLSSLREGDELSVRISGVRHMGPITLFTGQVLHGDMMLCKAQMKVFSE